MKYYPLYMIDLKPIVLIKLNIPNGMKRENSYLINFKNLQILQKIIFHQY